MSDPNGPGSLSPELDEEFLDVLDDTDTWELGPASWTVIDAIIGRARAAALAGDQNGFRDATADLELCSPTRGNNAGGGAKGKQPPRQRETKADLKHTLRASQQTGAGKSSGDPSNR